MCKKAWGLEGMACCLGRLGQEEGKVANPEGQSPVTGGREMGKGPGAEWHSQIQVYRLAMVYSMEAGQSSREQEEGTCLSR